MFSYVSDRADIARWRATCKTFARRGAPRLLNCDFYLELRHDNAESLYRFLYADERRFELIRGHMTVAVGGMTTYFMRCIVHGILRRCEKLTSLAVRDFDATVRSEPRLLVEWAASQHLTRFVIDYTPIGNAGPRARAKEGWRSDEILRLGQLVLPSVKHLEVFEGSRLAEDTRICIGGFHRMCRRSGRRRRSRRPVRPHMGGPQEKCWMDVLGKVFCEVEEPVLYADSVPDCRERWRAAYAPLEYLGTRRPWRRLKVSIAGGGTDELWDEYVWKVQQMGSSVRGEVVVPRNFDYTY